MKNCHPYAGENSLSTYQKNVENKLMSDIRVKEIQDKWTEKLNNANKQFFESDDNESALQEDLNKWYNSQTSYCTIENGDSKCLTNNQLSENYRKKIEELKELEMKYNTNKDSFKETMGKMDTLFFQRTLWLGSAIVLGAIALKQIRNV